MAVARPQGGPVLTGVHVALIAFVAVTVVALAFLVLMYTQQEDLRQRAEGAAANARSAAEKEQAAREQYGTLANLLTGKPDAEFPAIEQEIKALREQIVKGGGPSNLDARLIAAMRQVWQLCLSKSKEAQACEEKAQAASARYDELVKGFESREKEFGARTDEFRQSYEQQTQATEAGLKQQVKPIELLVAKLLKKDVASLQLDQDVSKAADELARLQEMDQRFGEMQAALAKLQKADAEKQQNINSLVAQLAKFRPSNDPMAVLRQADGKVIRVLPDQAVAYIDIGKRDRVMPGMTFAVYSPFRGVSKEGRGKATLEVTEVFPDTSQCKITSLEEPGGIVVAGDLVANPVFERGRTFNFAVAGDFNLNFDKGGEIDDPGGVKVRKLIESWGGHVVDNVDEQTDFVVLGLPPFYRAAPAGNKPEDEAARIRAEEQRKTLDRFNQIKSAAQGLSLPILTRLEFLQFIGYRVPPRAIAFAVAGDFDLNLDGVIDDPGGQKLRNLITRWGARVVDGVDEHTDFVVLGNVPDKPLDSERYNRFKAEAQKLVIPTMTTAEILDFLGRLGVGVARAAAG
ncbi:MAG: hypothetical protein ACPMAQ_05855 [Phycisphaerae bacterium]